MTVCPCCGCKFEGDLRAGCVACGARAVGEPLAAPEHELPAYGRALLVGAMGLLLLVAFFVSTLIALFESAPLSLQFWSLVAAAQTAAWRLKWIALPGTLIALWGGSMLYSSMSQAPARFAGQTIARGGLTASALVAVMMLTFIGVTVPERLRQRRRGIEAGFYAQGWTIKRALLEYRARYGTFPASLDDLRERLPDADGSIAAALAGIDSNAYKPSADLAALPKLKPRTQKGAALRRVSLTPTTVDALDEGISFTNYEVRMPGEDKVLGTNDDWTIRDGIITKPSPSAQQSSTSMSEANAP
ncbi:MAG TPA: hypothetical protein VD966_04510 [Pyrinomonadaceae bacterium]|nr:hypothetical protein [Pyrinomonadaceae bacterium]